MYKERTKPKSKKNKTTSNLVSQMKTTEKQGFFIKDNRIINPIQRDSSNFNEKNANGKPNKLNSSIFQLARKKLTPKAQANRDRLLDKRKKKHEKQEELRKNKADELTRYQGAHKSKMVSLLGLELKPKLDENSKRKDDYLKQKSKEISDLNGDKRPNKTEELTKKDDKLGSLTAHHLFPYNKIREEFAEALKEKDLVAIQNIMSFTGKKEIDSSEAYRLLAYQREHKPSNKWKQHQKTLREEQKIRESKKRGPQKGVLPTVIQDPTADSSSKRLDEMFRATTWASHNIFMGPEPKKRKDDPHENLDVKFSPSGLPTKSSLLAKEMDRKGFKGFKPTTFYSKLQKARKESKITRPYKSEEWTEEKGFYYQKGREVYKKKNDKNVKRLIEKKKEYKGMILKISKGMSKGQRTNVKLTNRGLNEKIFKIDKQLIELRKNSLV